MLKLIIVFVSVLFSLASTDNGSWSPAQFEKILKQQEIIRHERNQLICCSGVNRTAFAEYRNQIKHMERLTREIIWSELQPKFDGLRNNISNAASEMRTKISEAAINVAECSFEAQLPIRELQMAISGMASCLSAKIQPLEKFDEESEKIYADGLVTLDRIYEKSRRLMSNPTSESFFVVSRAVRSAAEEAISSRKEIRRNLVAKVDHFIDTTWVQTFSVWGCDPSKTLEGLQKKLTKISTKVDECIRNKISATSENA